jgi:hypothetical protein
LPILDRAVRATAPFASNLTVHRATVARRIADARQSILRHAQQWLQQRFHLGSGELNSLIGFVRSELDLSISRLLQSSPG